MAGEMPTAWLETPSSPQLFRMEEGGGLGAPPHPPFPHSPLLAPTAPFPSTSLQLDPSPGSDSPSHMAAGTKRTAPHNKIQKLRRAARPQAPSPV